MSTKDEDYEEQISSLQKKIALMREEIDFLKEHTTIQAGIKGEALVADMVSGLLARKNSAYDIDIGEKYIEVKYSRLNSPNKNAATKR